MSTKELCGTQSDDPTEQELTAATMNFLTNNANSIACSQTGQLSARLFIDVLETPLSPSDEALSDSNSSASFNDWDLTEKVLLYVSRRVQDREPLDDGASGCSEDQGSRKLTNKTHAAAKDTVTDEIRVSACLFCVQFINVWVYVRQAPRSCVCVVLYQFAYVVSA